MKLTKPQWEFFNLTCNFPAFVAGYAAGKTECKLACALRDKFVEPASIVALYDPTYDLARLNTIPRMCEHLESMPIRWKLDKNANIITIDGYGQFYIRTLDTPASIVGYEVWRSHVDELDTLRQEHASDAWVRVIARTRQVLPSGAPNRTSVYTTPEGFRFVYKRWVAQGGPDYQIVQAPTASNPHLPPGYIDSLRASYPAALLDAYLEGKFVNLTAGNVYNAYNRDRNRSRETVQAGEPLHIGVDFNVTNMSAVIHVMRDGNPHAVAELVGLYDTPSLCEAIKGRYSAHHVTVYPDASGGARKTVNAAISDIVLMKQAGFTVRANASNPAIKDRVAAANLMFERGAYMVNPDTCREYTAALEQLAYDKNGLPDKSSGYDHIVDSATYAIAYLFPIQRRVVTSSTSAAGW